MSDHDVILYGNDEAMLCRHVVTFLAKPIRSGNAAIVIASPQHERAFVDGLCAVGIDPFSDELRDRLIFLNAYEAIDALMVDGTIQQTRFDRLIGTRVTSLWRNYEVYAYGEMDGILRDAKKLDDAAKLERLWCALLEQLPFHLLCGYPVDVLSTEFNPEGIDSILCSHTRLISAIDGFSPTLQAGILQANDAENRHAIKGSIPDVMQSFRTEWALLPEAEATLLWLREHIPDHADEIIDYASARFDTVNEA
ncbi:MAG: MEDS domain-containing protein [Candidatus Eremiobacteraeota bacterium]|nr:MEDS domain-containing protein [Candidatus Eremiobacteraeota bacterium]